MLFKCMPCTKAFCFFVAIATRQVIESEEDKFHYHSVCNSFFGINGALVLHS